MLDSDREPYPRKKTQTYIWWFQIESMYGIIHVRKICVSGVSFPEDFAYALNEWSLNEFSHQDRPKF